MYLNDEIVASTGTSLPGKTFVIDHPLDKDKYLVHACLEGPESAVYYRGEGVISEGENEYEVVLPPYTKPFYDFTVQITAIAEKGQKPVFTPYVPTRVIDSKFTVYGLPGSFSWHVTGKRADVEVEPLKSETTLCGDGPYIYLK
jgi:hypothetical protein